MKPEIKPAFSPYSVGDRDRRPWGDYVVTGVGFNGDGEEYCEKEITVNPGQALSLQSHDHRRETWTVRKGVLTAIVDGHRIDLKAGQSVVIPQGSLHCMANLGGEPCLVAERQEGMCREDDIRRYSDAYGRDAGGKTPPASTPSVHLYEKLLTDIRARAA
jgi:mannose-6-phosphate isomerase-like protein (cupin superfamily)